MKLPSAQDPDLSDFCEWLETERNRTWMRTLPVALDQLRQWHIDPSTGEIRHETGRFFSINALRVHDPSGVFSDWDQPIIRQPEVGLLGILVRQFPDGSDRYLMQVKCEPGNPEAHQLAPTIQATRSNYDRVHKGRQVPYLDYFVDRSQTRTLTDVRQSEQGSWFFRKRNRNLLLRVTDEPPLHPGFFWLTLPELHHLLWIPNLVNMDARSVLASSLPALPPVATSSHRLASSIGDELQLSRASGPTPETLSWLTDQRADSGLEVSTLNLNEARGWHLQDGVITHELGAYFRILGVDVSSHGREVATWHQPMLAPDGIGLIGLLVHRDNDSLSVLMRAHKAPGCVDVAELGPTVQCHPDTLRRLPDGPPPFLDVLTCAAADSTHYDVLQAEEGGRFHNAQSRYVVVEVEDRLPAPSDYRWIELRELIPLLRHSFYLSMEARTILLCLTSLLTRI